MTAKLRGFFIFGVIWSALFYFGLNWAIQQTDQWWTVLLAVVYGVGYYVAGSAFGGAEKKPKSKMLGDYYALSAMITSFGAAVVWVVGWQPDAGNFILYLAVAYLAAAIVMFLITNSKKK